MNRSFFINLIGAIAAVALPVVVASYAIWQTATRSLAADLPGGREMSIHAFGDANPNCVQWTDYCRACARGNDGQAVCSNIGIACAAKPVVCTRTKEAAKDAPKDAPKSEPAATPAPVPKQ